MRQTIKFLMTRLSVCSLGVSCNEMIDTPMLLVVVLHQCLQRQNREINENSIQTGIVLCLHALIKREIKVTGAVLLTLCDILLHTTDS